MTREEKILKKQKRSFLRKTKRIDKDLKYLQISRSYDRDGIGHGRRICNGSDRHFTCEMGYSGCELRGYCNGDC